MPKKRYRIGRSVNGSDIVIEAPDGTVSSFHAELYQDELGRWWLLDRSRNGTFIYRNDSWRKLNHESVSPEESISFGTHVMTVAAILKEAQNSLEKPPQATPVLPEKPFNSPPKELPTTESESPEKKPVAEKPASAPNKGYIRDPETGKIRPRRSDE